MNQIITARELRASLPDVVARVRRGARFTVNYRSRPAFQITPMETTSPATGALESDSLYHAPAVGRSKDGRQAADHDAVLYRV